MTTAAPTNVREGIASITYLAAGAPDGAINAWLAKHYEGTLAVDVETTGLDVRATDFDTRQVCIGTSTGHAIVIDGSMKDLAVDCLVAAAQNGRPLWAHNATYDATAIASTYGLRLRGLRCSLVLVKALDPDMIGAGGLSLKELRPATQDALDALAVHWSRVGGKRVSAAAEHSWLPEAVKGLGPSDPVLLRYVATDAIECARLVEGWQEDVEEEEWELALLETAVEDLWRWPAYRGYALDMPLLETKQERLDESKAGAIERFGLDLTSNSNAVREWVAARGIRVQSPEGKDSLSHKHYKKAFVPKGAKEDWENFVETRGIAQTATKLKELREKQTGGRIYPQINAIGAHTGRMSIARPAIQNLPSRGENLRVLLLADPGTVLVGCDLDRVEPRVIAAMSEDEDLTRAVQGDVYTELAVAVWGEEVRGDGAKRGIAKTAFLAMIYGQGAKSLAPNLGVTVEEAAEILASLKAGYPTMAYWMQGIRARAKRGERLTTAYGRRLPQAAQGEDYKAVNWTIQGTAADLFKRITIAAAAALPRDSLYLPVHDELIVQVAIGQEQVAMDALRTAMTTNLLGVPITGEPMILGDRLDHA